MSRFVRFPSDRWLERLTRREADALDVGIMAMLVAVAQQQGGVGHRRVVTRLRDLHANLNLSHGERTTSNRLKKLRDLGEIAFVTSQGQRGPWTIEIVRDDYFRPSNVERRVGAVFEMGADRESGQAADFEVTSHDGSHERIKDRSTKRTPRIAEPRNARSPSASDQNQNQEEKDPNQGRASAIDGTPEVRSLIDISLRRAPFDGAGASAPAKSLPWVEKFLLLLPEHQRTTSAVTGIGRRVEGLPEHRLDHIYDEFSYALRAGGVRKPRQYLYGVLANEVRKTS
jgi:hypothetical protein